MDAVVGKENYENGMVLREAQVNDWRRLATFLAELSEEERSYFSRHAALEVDNPHSAERFRKRLDRLAHKESG